MYAKTKKLVRSVYYNLKLSTSSFVRCETEYKIVEDKIYKEECKVDIQHICEEHVTDPVEDYPNKDTSAASEEYHHFPNHPTDQGHIFQQQV